MHDDLTPTPRRAARLPLDRRRTLTLAASLLAIGSACPWARAFGLVPVPGLSLKLGWLTLGTAAVLAMLACLLVIGGVSSAGYGIVEPSWGWFLTLLASGAAFWAADRVSLA